uniref:RanBP2-type domain-containing protein n=1 Tax=Chromera velia CCMP2878 TaxID=1169474 RepID=A0A0G4HDP3_9ALVE|eukprot:Cvel_26365.t1-p1 / transcript=Cvel_26365.t1 / gene=Cvel_26365 / organism=Chromera_velia_CCMP2878 / gene_product=hypothetical protein / transcript_product=hypothetical protein / location=Cvel_scaffold3123:4823-14405(+) / protein_length=1116 / sequence_SO=supercontig / SO=protein_coding / is_pseudo=false
MRRQHGGSWYADDARASTRGDSWSQPSAPRERDRDIERRLERERTNFPGYESLYSRLTGRDARDLPRSALPRDRSRSRSPVGQRGRETDVPHVRILHAPIANNRREREPEILEVPGDRSVPVSVEEEPIKEHEQEGPEQQKSVGVPQPQPSPIVSISRLAVALLGAPVNVLDETVEEAARDVAIQKGFSLPDQVRRANCLPEVARADAAAVAAGEAAGIAWAVAPVLVAFPHADAATRFVEAVSGSLELEVPLGSPLKCRVVQLSEEGDGQWGAAQQQQQQQNLYDVGIMYGGFGQEGGMVVQGGGGMGTAEMGVGVQMQQQQQEHAVGQGGVSASSASQIHLQAAFFPQGESSGGHLDWICPSKKCGFVNFARRKICQRCSKEKPVNPTLVDSRGRGGQGTLPQQQGQTQGHAGVLLQGQHGYAGAFNADLTNAAPREGATKYVAVFGIPSSVRCDRLMSHFQALFPDEILDADMREWEGRPKGSHEQAGVVEMTSASAASRAVTAFEMGAQYMSLDGNVLRVCFAKSWRRIPENPPSVSDPSGNAQAEAAFSHSNSQGYSAEDLETQARQQEQIIATQMAAFARAQQGGEGEGGVPLSAWQQATGAQQSGSGLSETAEGNGGGEHEGRAQLDATAASYWQWFQAAGQAQPSTTASASSSASASASSAPPAASKPPAVEVTEEDISRLFRWDRPECLRLWESVNEEATRTGIGLDDSEKFEAFWNGRVEEFVRREKEREEDEARRKKEMDQHATKEKNSFLSSVLALTKQARNAAAVAAKDNKDKEKEGATEKKKPLITPAAPEAKKDTASGFSGPPSEYSRKNGQGADAAVAALPKVLHPPPGALLGRRPPPPPGPPQWHTREAPIGRPPPPPPPGGWGDRRGAWGGQGGHMHEPQVGGWRDAPSGFSSGPVTQGFRPGPPGWGGPDRGGFSGGDARDRGDRGGFSGGRGDGGGFGFPGAGDRGDSSSSSSSRMDRVDRVMAIIQETSQHQQREKRGGHEGREGGAHSASGSGGPGPGPQSSGSTGTGRERGGGTGDHPASADRGGVFGGTGGQAGGGGCSVQQEGGEQGQENVCFVCMRKFPSLEVLRKHEEKSKLHKEKLAAIMHDGGSRAP